MKSKYNITVGTEIGRLKVINVEYDGINRVVECTCVCKCGNLVRTPVQNLLGGNTRSCGCYHSEIMNERHRLYRMYGGRPVLSRVFGDYEFNKCVSHLHGFWSGRVASGKTSLYDMIQVLEDQATGKDNRCLSYYLSNAEYRKILGFGEIFGESKYILWNILVNMAACRFIKENERYLHTV